MVKNGQWLGFDAIRDLELELVEDGILFERTDRLTVPCEVRGGIANGIVHGKRVQTKDAHHATHLLGSLCGA